MKKMLISGMVLICCYLQATLVSAPHARLIAERILKAQSIDLRISQEERIDTLDVPLAYVYLLKPCGYLVLSAQEELSPLMAYSLDSDFYDAQGNSLIKDLLQADLSTRMDLLPNAAQNRLRWQELQRNSSEISLRNEYLLSTNWSQNAPYNQMCPMDPVSNSRSIAGCPAIAMGQILNYLQTTHSIQLGDDDDYYHNYSGRSYMIDDDHEELDFPSFVELNTYLNDIDEAFRYNNQLSYSQSAALVFACGTALKQVYSSQASGTFAVDQAYNAYLRFGFPLATLMDEDDDDIYAAMAGNIMEGIPVHLAVVTPSWDAGHNVVVDGYDSSQQNMFHLNFGWGGQYNAWYNLPEGIPYGLSVVEGAVVNLYRQLRLLSLPTALEIQAGGEQSIEIISLYDNALQLQDIIFGEGLEPVQWQIDPPLPASLAELSSMTMHFNHQIPIREDIQSQFRLVFNDAWLEIPVILSPAIAVEDAHLVPDNLVLQVMPNPFIDLCHFELSGAEIKADAELKIYNLKGQLIRRCPDFSWNGTDEGKINCPSGIYFYRFRQGDKLLSGKLLKL